MRGKVAELFGGLAAAALAFAIFSGLFLTEPFGSIRYSLLAAALFFAAASIASKKVWRGEQLERILSAKHFPWALAALAAVIFVRIKFLQWPAGQISGVDFSHIDYAIWSTSRGRFMEIPVVGTQLAFSDFFGNHFSPVLFFHVAARWLVDSPLSSLAVHALGLAAAIPALHALAKRIVDPVTASLLTLAYALCGAVASTLQFDLHQESFYPLAFAVLFLGLYGRAWMLWAGWLLALSVKEDSGVYLFPIFLFLAWKFPARRRHCLALSVLSIVATILTLKVLMPMHQPPQAAFYYLPMWGKYGGSFKEIAMGMATHPHWVAWDIVGNKDLYKNLLPWAFLPLLSPFGLLALPPIAVSATAAGVQKSFGLYYGIVLVPIFFFAAAHALSRFRRRREIALVALALSAFVGGSYLRLPPPLPFYDELRIDAESAAKLPAGEIVYVQSGFLPFLPYQARWRRIDGVAELPPAGRGIVVLYDGLAQGSLPLPPAELRAHLLALGYGESVQGRMRVYQ